MALTEKQKAAREGKLGGSDVNIIMSGDQQEIYNLWLEKTGDNVAEREKTWPMLLGQATEQIHLDWIEKQLGPMVRRGETLVSRDTDWAMLTLDGWSKDNDCPAEVKHNNGFEDIGVIFDRYMAQMHWAMFVSEREKVVFSVIRGARPPEPYIIEQNLPYMVQVVEQAEAFINCVRELREPCVDPSKIPPPPKVDAVKTVDMQGNNAWAALAGNWLTYRPAHVDYEYAAKRIKELCAEDAKIIKGHGIIVRRSKSGSLTIKPIEDTNGSDERDNP